MDNVTRKAALDKLQAMKAIIGHTDELMDDQKVDEYYDELKIDSGSYLKTAFTFTTFLVNKNYKALKMSVDKILWTFGRNVAVINTYNVLQRNSIGK